MELKEKSLKRFFKNTYFFLLLLFWFSIEHKNNGTQQHENQTNEMKNKEIQHKHQPSNKREKFCKLLRCLYVI